MGGDPFEHDDAAYLLGALPAPERAAYEQHLATCAACRARVESLRPIADGMGLLQTQDVTAVTGVAAERQDAVSPQLSGLLDAVARRRRRRTWTVRGLGGLAAAAVAALIVTVSLPGPATPTHSTPAAAQAMTALVPTPLTAQISLRRAVWGTEVHVQCRYLVSGYSGAGEYELVVVDRAGNRHALGSWTLSAGNRADFSSPVALARDAIRLVQVTRADGTPILQVAP